MMDMHEAATFKRDMRRQVRETKQHLSAAMALLDAGDVNRAYAEMEAAQHAAYDAKAMIGSAFGPRKLVGES